MIKRLFFLVIVLTMHFGLQAQELSFSHLMTENGLSQNSIFAIARDSRGFMWFGSRFGLNRYDGNHFRLYKSNAADSSTLSDDYITALYSDSKGNLWIGTSNGLNKFNPHKNTFERIYLNGSRPKNEYNTISIIYEDHKKNLWIGTKNGLYLLTAQGTFSPGKVLGLPSSIAQAEIQGIYEDHLGGLWMGTNKGLLSFRFDQHQIKSLKLFHHEEKESNSLSGNSVTAITEDRQNNLWIATENGGINLFDRAKGQFSRFQHQEGNSNSLIHNAVRKMILNKEGRLCIGTQEGLSIFDPGSRKFSTYQHRKAESQSLNHNSIYSLYEDPYGSLWIGTYYGGVNVSYANASPFHILQYNEKLEGISHNVVSSIVADQYENLWIGTEGGGLNYFNRKTGKFTAYKLKASLPESLGSDLVKVVYKDKEHKIWVGTHGGGLNLFDPARQQFKRFLSNGNDLNTTRSEIVTLLEDHQGAFWIGSQSGVRIFNKRNADLQPYPEIPAIGSIKDFNIKVLFEDAQKNIWIGSTKGLYLLTENRKELIAFKLPKGSNSINNNANYINCIQQDAQGNVWVGLYYGGLSKYDRQKKAFVKTYTTRDGLANNNVVGILEDDKRNLWISTSNGLSRFDPVNQVFQTYTTSDGLAGDEFNYNSFFKTKDGELFFGGYNGLSFFQPGNILRNEHPSALAFTRLRLFNMPVKINGRDGLLTQDIGFTESLLFHHDQNIFTLEFALLNYIKSNKNKYAYKLEGINSEWIESKVPAANYTNLPSGSYTFLVKGANNDGLWSAAHMMKITILPPLWKTWWAYLIYTAILAAVIFFVTRFFYLRGLLKKDEELHQLKLNFFTNISHEIRTHLTLIMAPVEKLIDGQPSPSPIRQQLLQVKHNADRLLKLVTELMDFRKADTKNLKLHVAAYDLIPFVKEIYQSFEELSIQKDITFNLQYDQEPITLYFDKEQLEKVFFNLLSNAFKFTPDHGRIELNIQVQQKQVLLSISNTGKGIAAAHLDHLFENYFQVDDDRQQNTGYGIGLALAKNIINLHKGEIKVISQPALKNELGYTVFELCLPLGNSHFQPTQLKTSIHSNASVFPVQTAAINDMLSSEEENKQPVLEKNKPHTVLVVEDNPELRQLIKESLEADYKMILAENGRLGWEAAVEEIPDLIISDVMMPEMDGLTLCHQLKTDERTSHIPVVLLTAKSGQTDQIRGLTQGADLYLSKPFSPKILQLQVRNLLMAREQMRKKYSRALVLEPNELVVDPIDERFLSRLIGIIESHMEQEDFGVDLMSEKIGMSQSVLYKKLKALTDLSVNDFAKSIRLKKAAQLLLQKQYTVYEVGYMVGFADRKYFSREFKKQFSKTPSEYIESNKDAATE